MCKRGAVTEDVLDTARRWLDAEPDDDIRAELQALVDGDAAELADRFSGRLQFGTAGLRAAVGAGPLRMNRLVVRQAAAGLAAYLLETDPDARRPWRHHRLRRPPQERRVRPRHGPRDGGARDPGEAAARPAADAGAGMGADRAGRHRRRDGHGVAQSAGRQRLQGVPRRRRPDRAAARRRDLGADRARRSDERRAVRRRRPVDRDARRRRGRGVPGVDRHRPPPSGRPRRSGRVHADARRRRRDRVRGVRARRLRAARRGRRAVRARSDVPDRGVPQPGGTGRDGSRSWRSPPTSGAARGDRQRPGRRPARRGDPAARRLVAPARRRRDRLAARRPHPRQHHRRQPARHHDAGVVVAARQDGRSTTACTRRRRSPGSSGSDGRSSTIRTCASSSATSRRSGTSSPSVRSTRTASRPR